MAPRRPRTDCRFLGGRMEDNGACFFPSHPTDRQLLVTDLENATVQNDGD